MEFVRRPRKISPPPRMARDGEHARRDFDERLEARHQVVTRAQRAAEAIVIAVGVAAGRAVGKRRILIFGALGRPLGGDLDAVEALRDARRGAERREDRKARQPGLHVG